jgi:hypothetical protein
MNLKKIWIVIVFSWPYVDRICGAFLTYEAAEQWTKDNPLVDENGSRYQIETINFWEE